MHTMIEDVDLPPVVMPSCAIRRTLAGQKALVTGANSGIGKGVAIALGKAGADVVVTYVARPEQAEEVVAAIRDEGGSAYAHQADVSQEDQVQAMFERMLDQLGAIDILVNNAGLQRDARLEDMSLKDWNTVIGVNLTGQFLCAREAVKEFKRRGVYLEVSCAAGKIVCVSSVHEVIPWAGHVNYVGWPGRRAPRIPCAARRPAVSARYSGQRSVALADQRRDPGHRQPRRQSGSASGLLGCGPPAGEKPRILDRADGARP